MPTPMMPEWIPTAGVLALIALLYLAKAAVVRTRSARSAGLWLTPMLALAVPVTWACDPDWTKIYFYPQMHWIGMPIGVLAVPAASLLLDLTHLRRTGRPRSAWWYFPELVLVFPAWYVGWVYFSFWVLGWGWI